MGLPRFLKPGEPVEASVRGIGALRDSVEDDTISEIAANAGVVFGPTRHPVDLFDLRRVGAIVPCGGMVDATGLGGGVLYDPVQNAIWPARRMTQYGQTISPGQIVLSVSFIRPAAYPPGIRITADSAPFGEVAIAFA